MSGVVRRLAPVPARQPGSSWLGLAPLRGTAWIAAATVILGISGYVFLTVTARMVAPDGYAALASLYLLVALIGPGLFLPVEQETTRLVSRWHALGHHTGTVVRQLAVVSGGLLVLVLTALAGLYAFLVSRVFHGLGGLWVALAATVAGYGGVCLIRGVFAGQRRLRGYAMCVGVDGTARLLPCLALVAAGVGTALPYGLALGLGPVAALVAVLPWFRAGPAGPSVPWRRLVAATAWLVAAWGLSFALANIAPVIVTALLPANPRQAGVFAFAFVIARVPLFLLLSLQAILLPALSRAAATHDIAGLRQGIRQGMLAVSVLAGLALVTTAPVVLVLLDVVFGRSGGLSGTTLTLLALGTVFAMLVQVLQPALLAVAGHRVVAAAWLGGAITFGLSFALPVAPVAAATLAQILAGATTVAIMATALRPQLRRQLAPAARPGEGTSWEVKV